MARRTGLNMTAYSLGGTSYLGDFENVEVTEDLTTVDGRGAAERFGKICTVLKSGMISTGLMRTGTACRVTALDVSAFTLGGTTVKPDWKSFSIRYNNTLLDAQGGSDVDRYDQAESTDYSGSLTLMVETTGVNPMAIAKGPLSGTNLVLSVTIASGVVTIPIVLTQVVHSITKGQLQEYRVTFGRGGTPTAVTGLSLFALGFTGSGVAAFVITSGAEPYTGDALIETGELSVEKGGLERQQYTLRVQGAFAT